MNNTRRKIIGALSALPLLGILSGCQDSAAVKPPQKRIPTMADGYRGFWRKPENIGQVDVASGKTPWMLVFFDPMCPYCLTFWGDSQELALPQLWVPVNVLDRPQGLEIGAWLLEAKEPEADFTAIKTALVNAQPFAAYPSTEAKEWILENTRRFSETGQRGVPTIVSFHPKREPRVNNGSMPKNEISAFIGE